MSPTSLSSSVLARSPNHAHNHTPCDTHTPPRSPNNTHIPQDHNPHYSDEAVPQADLYHRVINLEDLANGNSTGLPLQPCVLNQDLHLTSTGANETTTFLSAQEFRGNQQSKAESSGYGGSDDVSLSEFEPRQRCMDSPAIRSTPSSGYRSRQNSSLSRYHKPKQRHNTEGHPVTALVQLPTTAGGGYLVLHSLDLASRHRTSSTSQLQPTFLQVGASNLIHVQPASSADMEERACDMTSPRSREHLRLPLPGGMQLHRPSTELRTVVPEVMSPHHRLLDPSPLSGSPREYCSLGGAGEEFCRQNTSEAESTSSRDNINYSCQHQQDSDDDSDVQTIPKGTLCTLSILHNTRLYYHRSYSSVSILQ